MKNDYGIPISLFPSENLQLKGEKKGKISLHLLSMLTREPLSQNKLLTYLWYLNLGCTLRGLGVIQKFNNDDNDD